jgi:F0F1-type ATP synthase beta subunit
MAEGANSERGEIGCGRVVAVHSSVLDVRFPAGGLPVIAEAITIEWDLGRPLIAEVQLHLDATTVRAVALENTAGLKRGAAVRATGGPIRVPVGEPVLGRLLNAVGEPTDLGAPLPPDVKRRPIHGPAPTLARHGGTLEVFHTGIKVIDLLAPLVKGGKAAMIGGAGVGKTVLIMELIRTTVAHAPACVPLGSRGIDGGTMPSALSISLLAASSASSAEAPKDMSSARAVPIKKGFLLMTIPPDMCRKTDHMNP